VVHLVTLVDRLQRENRDLVGQVGWLSAHLMVAAGKIDALMAPEEPQDEPTVPESIK
jgi:hypothetical protein